uniref:Uncharacterized protein n=1 Tax=Klebsiella pneumoniae TaxID=573 RepID=A0A2P1BNK3_KLEPN|nr:hypothetical protein [Klebsiella pneumoniae]
MKDPAFSFPDFKEHHPLSCRGRGFDFVRGPAEPAPDITFTRLRAVRRKGVNEHGPVQMSGVSGKFFGLMKRQRNGRENLLRKALPSSTARRVVLVSAPANGLKRVIRVPGKGAGTRRNDGTRARNGVARRVPAVLRRHGERRDRDGRSKRCR